MTVATQLTRTGHYTHRELAAGVNERNSDVMTTIDALAPYVIEITEV